ncbi:MAG: nitrate reductase molybdenum cofactor assembly chaperone [Acidobacteria bacterium]|nr:MAG: nitrate reductase molybdenum cofactor assembly chaperone [Acidobacteriota bacterium]
MQVSTRTNCFCILEQFSEILSYPRDDYLQRVDACRSLTGEIDREAAKDLRDFSACVCDLTIEGVQEVYVQTFDLNPICALEVGWQLYGDNYERGNFLVNMRQELKRCGVPENSELPDHISHVLPLLARMNGATAGSLARESVIPALSKMLAAIAGKDSPYEKVLKALSRVLESVWRDSAQEASHD